MDVPVCVSLENLVKGIDDTTLDKAFGPDSLGIIIIKDLPDFFSELRLKVLKSASILANQPEHVLQSLENEESIWLTGWSCGKEILGSGKPDYGKGSFYVNCAFHQQDDLEGPRLDLCERYPNYKAYTSPNIWPPPNSGLETFKGDMKKLCSFIISVAEKVAVNCDNYISKRFELPPDYLQNIVHTSTCTKARLLHYYPVKTQDSSENDDDWCGEHLDHSCITGLTSALFIDESQGLTNDLPQNPDPISGLYIRNRHNQVVKVSIPKDCIAFQTGSALQEVSKGNFRAVSHFVKGTNLPSIARNTLAVFCQPDLDQRVNDKETFADFATRILAENH
ncbi:hypothetical protein PSN45_003387 [Yamadazyma tenuis]|uniref:Clavaminate synthase-like protein n=1 Tax=Candida tenuis (strain ATCC 10573 / BCRC 21748 / CBS 615 / JCM 9827 / NBRC 10315 / NRRL Y-1498 / VKM Y-70) TaxID=590646 RepID=G3AYB5_CANTC|nr:Clavaminate synthase-like protein [Yamadazyma tenuis ATCC 10573]XP_006684765.1 uncharacterized protein CANTEDRAFT_112677 [Yamadazyma tenuis ATCC 10573]EGV66190.1 Clavaminate synthase-like protein [Yamadazyma tenuis ATCC 10573]EGV66191.1 hypothetical protein CANTEDRAFT_112677 [Yamadazyma tenuis ATCC 10573]WEJ95857.1 hypothetical protein PSN45_003387 [Yamadazyma tenuis]